MKVSCVDRGIQLNRGKESVMSYIPIRIILIFLIMIGGVFSQPPRDCRTEEKFQCRNHPCPL